MNGLVCKREGCGKEVSEIHKGRGMVYCSRECAPYGLYYVTGFKRGPATEAQMKAKLARIRECIARGLTITETASAIGMSKSTIKDYRRRYGLQFVKGSRWPRPQERNS